MEQSYFTYYPATGKIVPGRASSESEVRRPERPRGWRRTWRIGKALEWLLYAVVAVAFGLVVGIAVIGWLEEGAGAACVEPTKAELVDAYHSEGMRVPGVSSEIRVECSEPGIECSEPTRTYLGRYYVTGYDTCASCCGKTDGITASGAAATVGRTCALNGMPFGTRLWIEGIGERVVEDRGGMRGQHIDVLCADHPACYLVTGYYEVWRYE